MIMFHFKVRYWDEDEEKEAQEQGFVRAETHGQAADKLVAYYGKDFIVSLTLCEYEDIITESDIAEAFEA